MSLVDGRAALLLCVAVDQLHQLLHKGCPHCHSASVALGVPGCGEGERGGGEGCVAWCCWT